MYEINSLKLIPENVKYFDFSLTDEDYGILTLEEKILRDPTQRERLRCEAGILSPKKRKNKQGVTEDKNIIYEEDDGELLYLMNTTESEIILDFHQNIILQKGERPPKPRTVKHFIAKWELSEEELNSRVLQSFIKNRMLKWITEETYQREKQIIEEKQAKEESLLEERRTAAEIERENSSHKDRDGIRKIGSGLEVREISGVSPNSGRPATGTTGDGGVIHFDTGSGPISRKEAMTENEKIIREVGIDGKGDDQGDVQEISDLSSEFSTE